MCGRYSLALRKQDLIAAFGPLEVDSAAPETPRYNIAPGQMAPIIVVEGESRRLTGALWGVPRPRRGSGAASDLINIRSEGLLRPSPWLRRLPWRRCGVPADGFFEWRTEAGRRVPWHVHRSDGRPFWMAGVCLPGTEGAPRRTAILTTAASPDVAVLHTRMPVILDAEAVDGWLDPALPDDRISPAWLASPPAGTLQRCRVSTIVNSGRVDSPDCVRPLPAPGELF